eukprot:GGOE01053198.1.p1 GENE.GGOE01053198.1~~GGOE01053198.1.p1  ORF type:complete len:111 (+),score=12.02 GGOE01053198.1:48-380(+)
MECDDLCPETQAEKAADREAMLKFWLNVRGTRATFHMYENVVAEAQYECVDGEQSSIFVKNLQTPLGVPLHVHGCHPNTTFVWSSPIALSFRSPSLSSHFLVQESTLMLY